MKIVGLLSFSLSFALCMLLVPAAASAQAPAGFALRGAAAAPQQPSPQLVEGPNVKVLTGLNAQQFQEEMNFIVQGLGVTCGTCHVRGNFASEEKPQKQTARKMLEMVKALNNTNFPDYKPKEGESVLGRVTCYTCHRGETTPKSTVGH